MKVPRPCVPHARSVRAPDARLIGLIPILPRNTEFQRFSHTVPSPLPLPFLAVARREEEKQPGYRPINVIGFGKRSMTRKRVTDTLIPVAVSAAR